MEPDNGDDNFPPLRRAGRGGSSPPKLPPRPPNAADIYKQSYMSKVLAGRYPRSTRRPPFAPARSAQTLPLAPPENTQTPQFAPPKNTETSPLAPPENTETPPLAPHQSTQTPPLAPHQSIQTPLLAPPKRSQNFLLASSKRTETPPLAPYQSTETLQLALHQNTQRPPLTPHQSTQTPQPVPTSSGANAPHSLPKAGEDTGSSSHSTRSAPAHSDWCPLDDGIEIDSTVPLSREDVNAMIQKILYGPSQRERLPAFTEFCPD